MCIVTNCAQFVSWSIRVLLPSDTFIILLDMGIHNFYCYSPSHTATDLLQLEGNSIYRNPQCGERPMDIGQNCTGCPTKILPLNLVGNVSSAFSEVFKNCKRHFKDQHWHQTPLSLHSLKKIENKTLLCNRILSVDATVQGCNRKLKGGKKPLKYIWKKG